MLPAAALYDIAALRTLETRATAALDDSFELMRRAGQAAWREALRHWPDAQRLVVVCGPGNNGGDGYMLARHALQSGRRVLVVRLPEHSPYSPPAQRAREEFVAAGGKVVAFEGTLPAADLIVDALFGIGLTRAPTGSAAALIDGINAQSAPVLSLDVPSGVDAATGATPGNAVMATHTLEFMAPKAGLRTGAALDHGGVLHLADLGIGSEDSAGIAASAELLTSDDLARWLRPRSRDSHKGRHGRVLCVGGESGHGGAILLVAEAALRSGAGLVDVATRAEHVIALLARLPEAMGHGFDDETPQLPSALLDAADVIAIGPGLGLGSAARAKFGQALASGAALVIDADALALLAGDPRELPAGAVLTPHPGEAARLLGITAAEVQGDRFVAARALCDRYACVVVLKGAGSVVAAPGQQPRIIGAGNPGMAVGGMGDVLCGVVAALRAQGMEAFQAASCGALLHAVAGDSAAREGGERGLLPTDLMPWLRRWSNTDMGG